jgi:RNA-binding protein PNO1
MAHKSHRQKALQAQLDAPREISLVKPKKAKAPKVAAPAPAEGMEVDGDEVLIAAPAASSSTAPDATASGSGFAPLPASAQSAALKGEFRRVPIPPHRMTPLKREWVNLYTPLVEMLGLQVRMNVKRRAVEIKAR